MALKRIPIGISDFKRLMEGNYYFVDKSMFIKELLDSGAAVTLFPRPRRFGKTLNLSMIRYFFEKTVVSNRHLFAGLKLENYPEYMAHQGQYPIIFLTFKDVKYKTWHLCFSGLKKIIAEEFRRHNYLLEGATLDDQQRTMFQLIMAEKADEIEYYTALKTLSGYLFAFHGKKAIILIDEYDAAIHEGFVNDYYNEIITFMRNFLTGGLKDNSSLELSVLTGILRIARESIFSGLNNLIVRTFLNEGFSSQFGLHEEEVSLLLNHFALQHELSTIRQWYDGYQSGPYKLYNPWSIINLIGNKGVIQPYWVNTSENALIKALLKQGSQEMKQDLELIIQKQKITKVINENIIMPDIYLDENAVWNFLLLSGYLTFENYRSDPQQEGQFLADLKSPNAEVSYLYVSQVQAWFGGKEGSMRLYQEMLKNLVAGSMDDFCDLFELLAQETISAFDVAGTQPEKFYHGLVLGMLTSLRDTHEIKSNRESGWGRYDIMIIPQDKSKPGIIIEFKTARKESLETTAQNALKQINDRQYETELKMLGIATIIKLGIAFKGKKSLIRVG